MKSSNMLVFLSQNIHLIPLNSLKKSILSNRMLPLVFAFILTISLTAGVASAQNISLPEPQKKGGLTVLEALSNRASVRSFASKDISQQQLSNLLWAAFGVNRANGNRTAPSTRNFQETDIYVLLKTGAYIYNAKENRLDLVVTGDLRELGGAQPTIKAAPVQLFLISDLAKVRSGDQAGKLLTASIDCGYVSQNIYLFCASAGLATVARDGLNKEKIASQLKLKPEQNFLLAHPVGYSKE
jgi:SagB-type dehydrogenase family enzyme